jgi:hypothetical protein
MTSIKNILSQWSSQGGDLEKTLDSLEDSTIKTAAEAASLVSALESLVNKIKDGQYQGGQRGSDLYELAVLVQGMELSELEEPNGEYYIDEVYNAINRLADACEALLERGLEDERGIPFACKVLAMWRHPRNPGFMAQVSTDERHNDSYLWEVMFQVYARHSSEIRSPVIKALSDPLPQNFMGVAFLDFTNRVALADELSIHPFNSEAGKAKLRSWLTDFTDDSSSYFQSATAALPWIDEPARSELLALAQTHPSPLIQIEVAWVLAKLGNPDGIARLQNFVTDPLYAERAQAYLQEFDVESSVLPPEDNPDFWAKATMATWLSHPNEFGRVPDQLEVFDTQVLFWPPTQDRRQLWLLKYTYQNGTEQIGLGLVGSITFALFGINTVELSPAEAYGLHCAWELQQTKDPIAPADVSVTDGLTILKQYNPHL